MRTPLHDDGGGGGGDDYDDDDDDDDGDDDDTQLQIRTKSSIKMFHFCAVSFFFWWLKVKIIRTVISI